MEKYLRELLEHGFILKSTSKFDIVKYRGQYFKLHKRNEQYCEINARSWVY